MKAKSLVIFAAIAIGTLLMVGSAVAEASDYGKLEQPALYDRLQTMEADEMIEVSIWLTPIDSEAYERKVLSKYSRAEVLGNRPIGKNIHEIREIRSEMFQEKKKAYASKEKSVIDFIEGKGFKVKYASIAAPLVFAELPKSVIHELEKRPDVDTIYLSKEVEKKLDTAVPTICVPYVWKKGYNGTGVKVAIVDVEPSRVDFSNPYLSHVNGGTFRPAGALDPHATQCAGVVASSHSTYKGVAPDVKILSANAKSLDVANLSNASDWAIANGAEILSCSIGEEQSDLTYDDIDRYYVTTHLHNQPMEQMEPL